MPESYYEVFTNGATAQMSINVPAGQDYLNDVEFWFYIKPCNGNQTQVFNVADVPIEMHKLIRSINIKVDSKQILYVDQAKYLLSIMQQRKKDSSQSLIHDYDSYPVEYTALTAQADANLTQGTFIQALPLSDKQTALFRHVQNAKMNRQLVSQIDDTVVVAEQGASAELRAMRKTAPRRFCLFKLSDLGMFKSFPRFLLKRGFEITLHLNTDHFAINSSPVVGVPAAGQNHTTLKSLAALAGGYDRWVLYDGKCIVRSTQPDE